MATRTISKTTSQRKIDAYRTTAPQQIDGQWVCVVKAGCQQNDHGSYDWTLVVRDCTDDERKQGRIAQIDHLLSLPLDNDIERRALENERRALQGRPTVEDEMAAAAAKRQAEGESLVPQAIAQLDISRDAKVADDDGDLDDARQWWVIRDALSARGHKNMGSINAVKQATDDEIRRLLTA